MLEAISIFTAIISLITAMITSGFCCVYYWEGILLRRVQRNKIQQDTKKK